MGALQRDNRELYLLYTCSQFIELYSQWITVVISALTVPPRAKRSCQHTKGYQPTYVTLLYGIDNFLFPPLSSILTCYSTLVTDCAALAIDCSHAVSPCFSIGRSRAYFPARATSWTVLRTVSTWFVFACLCPLLNLIFRISHVTDRPFS